MRFDAVLNRSYDRFLANVDLDQQFLVGKKQKKSRAYRLWPEQMLSNSTEQRDITPAVRSVRSRAFETAIGILIWLAFAVAAMVALYFLSFLAGD
jgi:hypothetical protein